MEHVYTFVEIQAKLPEFWLLFVNSHKAHKAFSISEAQSVLQYAEKKPLAKFSKKTWTNLNKNTNGKNMEKHN